MRRGQGHLVLVGAATAVLAGVAVLAGTAHGQGGPPTTSTMLVRWNAATDISQSNAAAGLLSSVDSDGYLLHLPAPAPETSYRGAWTLPSPDASAPAATVSSADIATTLTAAVDAGELPAPDGPSIYVVLLPQGEGLTPQACDDHHEITVASTQAQYIALDEYSDPTACIPSDPTDAVTVDLSRELVDTLTDPDTDGSGPHDPSGHELGDSCRSAVLGNSDGWATAAWWHGDTSSCAAGTPTVGLSTTMPTVTRGTTATFQLHVNDPYGRQASTNCQLDGQPVDCTPASPLSVSALAPGRHELSVSASDAGAVQSRLGTVDRVWTVDAQPPTVKLVAPPPITFASSLTIRATASDAAGSGVTGYDFRYRTAALADALGPWIVPRGWTTATMPQVTLALAPARHYCFSARAYDDAGNASTWSPPRCTSTGIDDRSLTASRRGWRRMNDAGSYRGTLTVARQRGAALHSPPTLGTRLGLLLQVCPNCGSIAVYRNGRYLATIDTASAVTRKQVLIILPGVPYRPSRLTLALLGASRPVYVDGLGAWTP